MSRNIDFKKNINEKEIKKNKKKKNNKKSAIQVIKKRISKIEINIYKIYNLLNQKLNFESRNQDKCADLTNKDELMYFKFANIEENKKAILTELSTVIPQQCGNLVVGD